MASAKSRPKPSQTFVFETHTQSAMAQSPMTELCLDWFQTHAIRIHEGLVNFTSRQTCDPCSPKSWRGRFKGSPEFQESTPESSIQLLAAGPSSFIMRRGGVQNGTLGSSVNQKNNCGGGWYLEGPWGAVSWVPTGARRQGCAGSL